MKIKKVISIILSVSILVIILSANSRLFTLESAELKTYIATESFSTVKQPLTTPWRYQVSYPNGSTTVYENLPWNSTDKYWGNVDIGIVSIAESDLVTGLPSLYMHTGGLRDATVTFKVPFSGTVEVNFANGGIFAPYNGEAQKYDGVNLFLYKEKTQIFSKTAISNKNSNPVENRILAKPITVKVRKNEHIYFVVKPNKTTDNDSTYMNPQVKYISLSNEQAIADTPDTTATNPDVTKAPDNTGTTDPQPTVVSGSVAQGVYKFLEMYSAKQDPWFYYYYNGGVYSQMTFLDQTWTGKDLNAPHAIISKTGFHPAPTGVTTLAFKSPKSGKIQIGMESTLILLSPKESVDGTIISVVSDSKLLCDQYWITNDKPSAIFKPLEVDVYKDQMIYFYLSKAVGNQGDSTRMEPYVKYLDYKDVPTPTIEAVSTSSSMASSSTVVSSQPQAVQNTVDVLPDWAYIALGALASIAVCAIIFAFIMKRKKVI